MCLSTVYETKDGTVTLVLQHVNSLLADEGTVTVTDIMGGKAVVNGVVKSFDMERNVIMIEARE